MHSSIKPTPLQKVLHFFFIKMIVGIAVIVAVVALIELLRSVLLDKTNLSNDIKAIITAITEAVITLAAYIILFKASDKRQIHELSREKFISNASTGFMTGLLL